MTGPPIQSPAPLRDRGENLERGEHKPASGLRQSDSGGRLTQLLARLNAKRSRTGWLAKCPAHDDGTPSLSISTGTDGRILLHCHAGCTTDAVCEALGIKLADLMPEHTRGNGKAQWQRPAPAFSWATCSRAFNEGEAAKLAEWRGYRPEFVGWLREQNMIGLQARCVAFPVHGEGGAVIGCHYRLPTGSWRYAPAGVKTRPLVLGDLASAREVWTFESPWDALAVADRLGWHDPGNALEAALVATRGASNGKLVAGLLRPDAIVTAWPQNDQPGRKWLADVARFAGGPVRAVALPNEHKDANDWTQGGATAEDLRAAMEFASIVDVNPAAPEAEATALDQPEAVSLGKPLAELRTRQPGDDSELLRHGYLCRGAGLLLVGPTGIGKSSLALQTALCWGLGREAFGIVPTRPLRSLLVQAENSPEDLAEVRDGVLRGLGFSPEQAATATGAIVVLSEDSRTGPVFFDLLSAALEAHRPDLLWLDPLLAYLGGDVSKQEICTTFLRNHLNPLLHQFGCAVIIVHHVNKPAANAKSKPDWRAGDLAYLGSGSAELANWPRAVLAMRNIGSHEVFELVAGKRGGRLGWTDAVGLRTYARHIAHHREPGIICWREANADEVNQGGRPAMHGADDLLDLLPPEGLASSDWAKLAKSESGVSERWFFKLRKQLENADRIVKSKVTGRWQPILK